MARLRSVQRGSQDVRVHPSEVDCFYQVIEGEDGAKYLHLSTFGSDNRASGPKSSQSMQMDEELARDLVEVIRKAFPGI